MVVINGVYLTSSYSELQGSNRGLRDCCTAWKFTSTQPCKLTSRVCRGIKNEFIIEDRELGPLSEISIGHDNSGEAPGWNLEYVLITNLANKQEYFFPCRQWFDAKQGDGLIVRRLKATK